MSPEKRSAIARKAALARHESEKLLEAIRLGNFNEEFGFDAECYVLNDANKTAVMSQRGMAAALGITRDSGTALRSLVKTKAISSTSLGAQILEKLDNPLIFKGLSAGAGAPPPSQVHGHDVGLLIDLCNAILEAKLAPSQAHLTTRAAILLGASAKSGLQGLVYKLTGYDATKEEVVAAFRAFIQEEAKRYEREFPPELYLAWARLYNITADH